MYMKIYDEDVNDSTIEETQKEETKRERSLLLLRKEIERPELYA